MKNRILEILCDADDYVSGQELCETLGVSRTSIWKNINKLKEEGYQISAIQNKGYRIMESPDVINLNKLNEMTKGRYQICYLEEVDSTNTYAKTLAEKGSKERTLVLADLQVSGKGRRGRQWVSPKGTSISATILLRPKMEPKNASMITLIMGLAAAKAIREITNLDAQIKWPNDVVISGKKVCGILTEMNTQIDFINYVVVGVGINVNVEHFSEEISHIATSLMVEGKQKYHRIDIVSAMLRYFEEFYEAFLDTHNLEKVMEEYNQLLVNVGRRVRVLDPRGEYEGEALGINQTGELQVKCEDGIVREVSSGEVSVRGIYGYI